MPNPSTTLALSCVCALAVSSSAIAQTGARAGQSYAPPPKIDPVPLPFRPGTPISVKTSVYKPQLNAGGAHPPVIELRVVAADADGNPPATGGTTAVQPAGTPNWAHWSPATFASVPAPNVGSGQTLAMVVSYKTWSAVLRRYIVPSGSENKGLAVFRIRCGRPPAGVCAYVRQ
jgi:hypothetical protein